MFLTFPNMANEFRLEIYTFLQCKKLTEEYRTKGECFIAILEDKILGVYVLLPIRPETVELVNIAVAEEHQGKGIGKQLINHVVHYVRSKGYKTIEIGTGNSSFGQLALYQICGFQIIGADRNFFLRHYEEEIFENGIHCRDMMRLSQDL